MPFHHDSFRESAVWIEMTFALREFRFAKKNVNQVYNMITLAIFKTTV